MKLSKIIKFVEKSGWLSEICLIIYIHIKSNGKPKRLILVELEKIIINNFEFYYYEIIHFCILTWLVLTYLLTRQLGMVKTF